MPEVATWGLDGPNKPEYRRDRTGCGHIVVYSDETGRRGTCQTAIETTVIKNGKAVRELRACGKELHVDGNYLLIGCAGENYVYLKSK